MVGFLFFPFPSSYSSFFLLECLILSSYDKNNLHSLFILDSVKFSEKLKEQASLLKSSFGPELYNVLELSSTSVKSLCIIHGLELYTEGGEA